MASEISSTGTTTGSAPQNRPAELPTLKLDTTVTVVEKTDKTDKTKLLPPPARKVKTGDAQKNAKRVPGKIDVKKSTRFHSDVPGVPRETTTPVMLSIFPTVDTSRVPQQPSVPVAKQPIAKQPIAKQPLTVATTTPRTQYSASIYSQPSSPPQALIAGEPWTASQTTPSIFPQSPPLVEGEFIPHLSAPESLLDFWTIAQGQESLGTLPTYTLVLKCKALRTNHESISLASNKADVYTANVAGATISIMRKHPVDFTSATKICAPTYESPTTTSPILAALFPLLAEERAIETAKEIANECGLDFADSKDLQEEAVNKAKQQESGALLWDSDSSNYYFTLPSLNPQPGIEVQATALSIEYKPEASIEFFNGSSQSLLKLNLVNYEVTLQMRTIVGLSSSAYTLDTLISALLILLVHLHRHEGILALPTIVAPYFEPPPKSATKQQGRAPSRASTNGRGTPTPQATNNWISRLAPYNRTQSRLAQSPYTTNNNSTLTFDKDLEMGLILGASGTTAHRIPPMTTAPIAPNGIAPELRASNTGVDLSRFQAFDLDDPDLGNGTKIALRVLYWGFSVTVWLLGVFIGVLAAVIVAIGGCLGKGKGSREG